MLDSVESDAWAEREGFTVRDYAIQRISGDRWSVPRREIRRRNGKSAIVSYESLERRTGGRMKLGQNG
jgi:hypothetical protein